MQIVQSLLEKMGGLSRPQIKGLTTLFATILIVCGKVNFTNLSRYSSLSEKTYRRRFKQSFAFVRLNVGIVEATMQEPEAMIALMDGSFIPKSGKRTFGLDQFYNGSHGRVEKGLEVSLIAVVNVKTEVGYSIQAEQTFEQTMFPELTRMDYYLDQLERVRGHLPAQVRYLAVDGAYAHQPFVTGVVVLKLDVISRLRRDANLRFLFEGKQKARGARRKYASKVNLADSTGFTWVRQLQPGVDLFTQVVWHVSLKRQIRLAYLKDTRKSNKPSYVVLFGRIYWLGE
ncbi:hypothetical protein ACKFKF_28210 [Phormidesmis sp. 146-12]